MKKIGIVMMTYFTGLSFKAAQMPEIIHRLSKQGQLGKSFGLPYEHDTVEYTSEELQMLKRSKICRILFAFVSNLSKITKQRGNTYLIFEKIYGLFARLTYSRTIPEIVVMKPRPANLVEYMKKKGAFVVVEASENHTRFTCDQMKNEAKRLGIELTDSNYVNEDAITDYEKGIDLADGLICLTEFSKKTYIDRNIDPAKIKIVPLNLDLPIDQPRKTEDELIFVSVAMHSVLKGTYRLVKVWKDYKIKNKLIIVGKVNKELKKMLETLGDVENVEFVGYKSYSEMRKVYLKNRCVGVLLSFSESFGRSIYECMCTSTPVIVTPFCTLDMVENGKNGRIVDPANENDIFSAVEMFIKLSPEEYYQYQCNVHQVICEHKIDFGKEYVDAINELASKESIRLNE